MRIQTLAIGMIAFAVSAGAAENDGRYYTWKDADGQLHYGDSIPPEYSELKKQVVNDAGVVLDELEGKKSEAELAAELRAEEERLRMETQLRADKALLATYLSVEEIERHRDNRVELFQAQSRVTELYLRNLRRQLEKLEREASRYQPYSDDPDAQMVDPALVADINETKAIIERHEGNLDQFKQDEQQIIARFEGDITRFKSLKGID